MSTNYFCICCKFNYWFDGNINLKFRMILRGNVAYFYIPRKLQFTLIASWVRKCQLSTVVYDDSRRNMVLMKKRKKIIPHTETPNLSTDADSSINNFFPLASPKGLIAFFLGLHARARDAWHEGEGRSTDAKKKLVWGDIYITTVPIHCHCLNFACQLTGDF